MSKRLRCTVCNWIYDETKGDPDGGIPAGTKFEDIPDDWRCPVCGVTKDKFVLLEAEKTSEPVEKKAPIETKKSVKKTSIKKEESAPTVSDILVSELVAWGVEYVFGLPGTSCLGIVDALRRNPDIEFILVRHEEAAALTASAYAKLTGKLGVCLTIAGPGATNLITGLYDAKLDRAPVLALTGGISLSDIGPINFQEIDQDALFEPITVFHKTISTPSQTKTLTSLAIKHALSERGVVNLTIPNDIQKMPFSGVNIDTATNRLPSPNFLPDDELLHTAGRLIDENDKVVIVAGRGALGVRDMVKKLAKKIGAPVASTYPAKGVIPESDPLALGALGDVGSATSRQFVEEADLLIVLGSSYSNKSAIPKKPTVQIDFDLFNIGKTKGITNPLLGNIENILPKLLQLVKKRTNSKWLSRVSEAKKEWEKELEKDSKVVAKPIRPAFVMQVLSKLVDSHAIISLDVGDHNYWYGKYFPVKNQTTSVSGYLGTMGYGLPSGIAGAFAKPEKQSVVICSDGGFTMLMGDFLTAVRYKLPITVVLLNNSELAKITLEQSMEDYPKYSTELNNLNFADFAKNCGGIGYRVEKSEDLEGVFTKALQNNKPTLVEVITDPRHSY